jgi:C-terminal processing protease CtpA/Prc
MRETAAVAAPEATGQADAIANLRAFARLYGFVRFFHPSDEASLIDWSRFAVLGAGKVAGCANAKALRTALIGLFGPVAPSVQVYGAGAQPQPVRLPGDSAACLPVCWQHCGVGLTEDGPYHSERTNRPKTTSRAARYVAQWVVLPPSGSTSERKLRVRAQVRAEQVSPSDQPELIAAGFGPEENPTAAELFARASAVPITGVDWHPTEVEAVLEPGQTNAWVGVVSGVSSRLWADDFEASVSCGDSLVKLELKDAGFEDSGSLKDSPGWMGMAKAEKSTERPFAGGKCLFVGPGTEPDAFAGSPLPGEHVDKPLDRGLSCRVPLCLWSKDGHTLPRASAAELKRLQFELDALSLDTAPDPSLEMRIGDVVIAWATLQHFYPYFDVVPVDWDTILTVTLTGALHAANRAEFVRILKRMSAALHDGHAGVSDSRSEALGSVPARLEEVEGRVVVIAAAEGAGLCRGDVLLAVNGRPVDEALEEQVQLASGTPQFRRVRGLIRLLAGPKNDTLHYVVERGSDTVTVGALPAGAAPWTSADTAASIRELTTGIWYVDLTRAPMAAIDSAMDKLAKVKGLVFDMRGYPNANHDVISHLLTGQEQRGEQWMWIPRITYPDRERMGWDGSGWSFLQPKEPRIAGKVVFLTDGSAVSYAESLMSHIEGFRLAEIVGGPTAGTNGNVNSFILPGGFQFFWTGMKVTKFDGSQHHLIGVRPTVPLVRTLKAVREGRDEYIEKALALIQGS